MLGRQVRERADAEVDADGALLVQGVARNLHHRRRKAALDHLGEIRRKVVGVGRGHLAGNLAAADDVPDRPDDAGRPARLFQDAPREERRRGLAVGARDAADGQPPRGVAGQCVRGQGECLASVAHHDKRRPRGQVYLVLDHGGPRARLKGGLHELVAVGLSAGHGDEQVPRPHAPRVVDGAQHVHVGRPDDTRSGDAPGQLAQFQALPLMPAHFVRRPTGSPGRHSPL